MLNAYFAERHEPCPKCDYDLFGQHWPQGERPRCPECGRVLRPVIWLGGAQMKEIRVGGRERTPRLRRIESVLIVTGLLMALLMVVLVLAAMLWLF
ncbi:MAG: hypothetical protein EA378_03635 [Phycisphaerales bacterium]|nr:MAG: hypothetical protein EA378_03635 [Phycisphaerales bacterium]